MDVEAAKKQIIAEAYRYLTQIGLELEASAAGAKTAATLIQGEDPSAAQGAVQQMYARLDEARDLVQRFQKTINEAVARGLQQP